VARRNRVPLDQGGVRNGMIQQAVREGVLRVPPRAEQCPPGNGGCGEFALEVDRRQPQRVADVVVLMRPPASLTP
jgi:hypothetical protein